MDKYFVFRSLVDFVADHFEVTDASMKNYCGEIEVSGVAEDGSTISIRVRVEEAEENGN